MHFVELLILLYCHLLIHAEIYIYMLDTYRHNEQQTQEDFFIKIFTSHFICKGSKRLCGVLLWRPNRNCNILTPLLWPSALCLSRSPGLLNRRPKAHSAGCWFSLLHLISIFSGPQFIRAPMAPSAWCGFPYHISSLTALQLNWLWLDF